MNYPETIIFRCTVEERQALAELRRAYELPTLSETARAVIRQVAADRGLDAGNGTQHTKEMAHEPSQ